MNMVSIWKYARDDLNNYLVLYLTSGHEINEFELKMCADLEHLFLTPIYDTDFDLLIDEEQAQTKNLSDGHDYNVEIMKKKAIKYKINNSIMLSKYLDASKMEKHSAFQIMEQIVNCYYASIEYLLIPNQILFDLDKIFYDFRTEKVHMVYIPIEGFSEFTAFKDFAISYFSIFVQQKSPFIEIYRKILDYCMSESFCMDGFKNILSHYKKGRSDYKKEGFDTKIKRFDAISEDFNSSQNAGRAADKMQIDSYDPRQWVEEEIENGGFGAYDADDGKYEEANVEEFFPQIQSREIEKKESSDSKYQYLLKRDAALKKNLILKCVSIYLVLIFLYLILILNSGRLFGGSLEITIFISILFFAVCVYLYIKFIHEDFMHLIKAKREKKRREEFHRGSLSNDESSFARDVKLHHEPREEIQGYFNKKYLKHKALLNSNIKESEEFSYRGEENKSIRFKNKFFETELLSANHRNYLINMITGEKVYLDKEVFKIGRHEDKNDYVLDDKSVGRFHIQIDSSQNGVFITDLGSKNGTFINENRLFPYTKSNLKKGDFLRLAGVTFSFNS